MPFTASHIVAALPLNNGLGSRFSKYTALSPLVIGSMVPDVAYVTPFLVHQRVDSHTLLGIYLFAIPMGLTIYFLYHWLMAPVWFSLYPRSLQQRLNPNSALGKLPDIPSHVLLISLILGAITHIVWDFFTHQRGIPQYIAWMDHPLIRLDGYDIMPYRVIQHLSSILGLALLLFIIYRWFKRTTNSSHAIAWQAPKWLKLFSYVCLLVVPTCIATVVAYRHLPETDVLFGLYSAQIFVKYAIVTGAGVFLLNSGLLGILYQYHIGRDLKDKS